MATLYELSGEYASLLTSIDMCDDDDEREQFLNQLDAVSDDIVKKSEAYARIILNEQSDSDAYAAEIKRLRERKAVKDHTIEHLKENLFGAMQMLGTRQIETAIGKWRIQKNPASVKVLDAGKVPNEFLVEQPPQVNKSAILSAYRESGEIPEGTDIVQTESLRFR